MVNETEELSQRQHLDELIKDFERDQTIQDVGTWLIHDTLDPLPPSIHLLLGRYLTHSTTTTASSMALVCLTKFVAP